MDFELLFALARRSSLGYPCEGKGGKQHVRLLQPEYLPPVGRSWFAVEVVYRRCLASRHTKRAVCVGNAVMMMMKSRYQDHDRDTRDEEECEKPAVESMSRCTSLLLHLPASCEKPGVPDAMSK
jgi:hypothetical protein